VVHTVQPDLGLPEGWLAVPVRVEWMGSSVDTDWSGKVTVVGGEILQTSHWSPEIVAVDRESVSWHASTTNFGEEYGMQRGGVEFTVVGTRDARIIISTAQGGDEVPLQRLLGDVAHIQVREPGRLRLQQGIGGLAGLGSTEFRFNWIDPDGGPAWYYLRAFQTDGEMAWSSPVWIDPVAG
jgi:hypothetical protein